MKTKLTLQLGLIVLLLFSQASWAQNDSISKSIKPLRIGLKFGIPNILAVNAEYVSPLLNNRVAVAVDYFSMSPKFDNTEIKYKNFEVGTNIYFNNRGKGFYGGISYFSFDGEGTYTDVEFDDDTVGDGTGKIEFNTINLKVGAKLGGTFYFRFELGYGFGDIPDKIYVSNDSGQSTYEDLDIPGISTSGIPVFTLGFGVALF